MGVGALGVADDGCLDGAEVGDGLAAHEVGGGLVRRGADVVVWEVEGDDGLEAVDLLVEVGHVWEAGAEVVAAHEAGDADDVHVVGDLDNLVALELVAGWDDGAVADNLDLTLGGGTEEVAVGDGEGDLLLADLAEVELAALDLDLAGEEALDGLEARVLAAEDDDGGNGRELLGDLLDELWVLLLVDWDGWEVVPVEALLVGRGEGGDWSGCLLGAGDGLLDEGGNLRGSGAGRGEDLLGGGAVGDDSVEGAVDNTDDLHVEEAGDEEADGLAEGSVGGADVLHAASFLLGPELWAVVRGEDSGALDAAHAAADLRCADWALEEWDDVLDELSSLGAECAGGVGLDEGLGAELGEEGDEVVESVVLEAAEVEDALDNGDALALELAELDDGALVLEDWEVWEVGDLDGELGLHLDLVGAAEDNSSIDLSTAEAGSSLIDDAVADEVLWAAASDVAAVSLNLWDWEVLKWDALDGVGDEGAHVWLAGLSSLGDILVGKDFGVDASSLVGYEGHGKKWDADRFGGNNFADSRHTEVCASKLVLAFDFGVSLIYWAHIVSVGAALGLEVELNSNIVGSLESSWVVHLVLDKMIEILDFEWLFSVAAMGEVEVIPHWSKIANVKLWVASASSISENDKAAAAKTKETYGKLNFMWVEAFILVGTAGKAKNLSLTDLTVDKAAVVTWNSSVEHAWDFLVRDLDWVSELITIASKAGSKNNTNVWAVIDFLTNVGTGLV